MITAVYVAFRTRVLDLGWIPDDAAVVVVHNDRELDPGSCRHPGVRHLFPASNLGFGAGVNLAAAAVSSGRLVVCNPDTLLTRAHWEALTAAEPDEVVTVPLVDAAGRPTSVVNRYPTFLSLLGTAYRAGRLLPLGSWRRAALTRLLGSWGREHQRLPSAGAGSFPLATHWASAAAISVDAARFAAVGGFEAGYFLYFEDVDLCLRLADKYPTMRLLVPAAPPGRHTVGASADGRELGARTEFERLRSLRHYARAHLRAGWPALDLLTRPRLAVLARAARLAAPR